MKQQNTVREFFVPAYQLDVALFVIAVSSLIYLLTNLWILAALPILAMGVSMLLDKRWMVFNDGADIIATNNILAMLLGVIVGLSAWIDLWLHFLLWVDTVLNVSAYLRFGSSGAILLCALHAMIFVRTTRLHVHIIRGEDARLFNSWFRVHWLIDSLLRYGLLMLPLKIGKILFKRKMQRVAI